METTTQLSTRQLEIIEAAGRILTSVGVSGMTTKNLAKEMGFSESAIYRHFASKEAIVLAMLNYLAENMNKSLGRVINENDSPILKFEALFGQQFLFFKENPHFMVAVFSDGLMAESKPINDAIFRIMNIKMNHLSPIIREGQQKGVFSHEITSDEMILIVMGSFRLQMFRWRLANFEFDIVRAGENMLQSLLTIIKK